MLLYIQIKFQNFLIFTNHVYTIIQSYNYTIIYGECSKIVLRDL